ncbi:hypothetical protein EIN_146080 [Entamoeba invadens IP1]|uniref:Uncharacterized protein n=1 Tax=Entamoeba invadens IP1 TaxID=370355 RepID=L7FNA1_ENTIV|nr:hypothetical protein EIN_146080 [Entamoeba invadens IP1]ELP87614.1 hypothetical protein EIN_146080 [Entamoeba invadens IP1]|eukprot:XP_004254385.1 hypothetical protein EIN_146080 [Entamoeba invadens IP1]
MDKDSITSLLKYKLEQKQDERPKKQEEVNNWKAPKLGKKSILRKGEYAYEPEINNINELTLAQKMLEMRSTSLKRKVKSVESPFQRYAKYVVNEKKPKTLTEKSEETIEKKKLTKKEEEDSNEFEIFEDKGEEVKESMKQVKKVSRSRSKKVRKTSKSPSSESIKSEVTN